MKLPVIDNRASLKPWVSKNGRLYLAAFYFFTGLWMMAVAVTLPLAPAFLIASLWPAAWLWILGFVAESIVFFYLGFTTHNEKYQSRNRGLVKLAAVVGSFVLITIRAIAIYAAFPALGFVAVFTTPLWMAFIIAWAVPLIWYLPRELSDYDGLADRIDRIESDIENMKHENPK